MERIIAVVRSTVRWRLKRWAGRLIDGLDEDDLVSLVLESFLADDSAVLRRFDPELGTEAAFFREMTLRRVKEQERKYVRRREIDTQNNSTVEPAALGDPDEWLHLFEADRRIREWLEKRASATDRQIFRLALMENMSNSAIAEAMGMTSAAVANRLFAVRKHIARQLANLDG